MQSVRGAAADDGGARGGAQQQAYTVEDRRGGALAGITVKVKLSPLL